MVVRISYRGRGMVRDVAIIYVERRGCSCAHVCGAGGRAVVFESVVGGNCPNERQQERLLQMSWWRPPVGAFGGVGRPSPNSNLLCQKESIVGSISLLSLFLQSKIAFNNLRNLFRLLHSEKV